LVGGIVPVDNIIKLRDVIHKFYLGKVVVPALMGIDLDIGLGEFLALVGPSGSGKSTLLNIIGGLCRCTSGEVFIRNCNINNLTENQICLFRRKHIGFIFQSYNLFSNLTAIENIEMPLTFAGLPKKDRQKKAEKMIDMVGLWDRMNHKPNELSGGQQQRVSIARALINNPDIILADEPTGNLDSVTGMDIMKLMKKMNQEFNTTFIVVTHNWEVANYAHRIVHLKDGRITKQETRREV
jgi:putative ABC transport system ATP-binding protein